MVLSQWDPWSELASLQRDVQELFGRTSQGTRRSGSVVPAMDAFRTPDGLVIRMEMPGLSSDDVDVHVERGVLTVSGERKQDVEVNEGEWLRRERSVGRFTRSVTLPEGVDPQGIQASFTNGLLELRVPQSPEQKARRIPVAGGGEQNRAIDVDSSSPSDSSSQS